MARPRTTKELAKRIELNYYRRLHPWRRWRRNISLAAVGLAAAWLAGAAVRGDHQLYNSGPLSTAHTLFAARCNVCHMPGDGSRFWLHATDRSCVACHDGPAHQANQIVTPGCVSCHVEHKGHVVLADLNDPHCTRCHERLAVKSGAPRVETRITNFTTEHPDFAVLRNGGRDGAQVKLNHEIHLKAGLRGPNGPVQMVCRDCHRADNRPMVWPYEDQASQKNLKADGREAVPVSGRYMNRIAYARHCIGCHPLGFDARFPSAPHATPENIRVFLRVAYTTYAAEHPGELSVDEPEEDAGGLRRRNEEETGSRTTPEQWVQKQVTTAENLLYRTKNKGCPVCHEVESSGDLPKIAPTAIPRHWFKHAVFDHRAHRELRCVACHGGAPTSRDTADVLLPRIDTCRKCHVGPAGARTSCVECHLYHDKTRERDPDGPLLVKDLAAGGESR